MKDWGRWRWHLKFTVRLKSLLNFVKFYTLWSQSSVHLYNITVHVYCMYSTGVQHVMSLLVPAWWHWSGCRGSSSRSRSQGSLGSVPSTGAPSGAGAGAESWEPEWGSEPRPATPDQGLHSTSQPAHQQQPALCITPGNTRSVLIIKTRAQFSHLCRQICASVLMVRQIKVNMNNPSSKAKGKGWKINYT